jgi:hypothetical protein
MVGKTGHLEKRINLTGKYEINLQPFNMPHD